MKTIAYLFCIVSLSAQAGLSPFPCPPMGGPCGGKATQDTSKAKGTSSQQLGNSTQSSNTATSSSPPVQPVQQPVNSNRPLPPPTATPAPAMPPLKVK